jgi:hypothetical protein
MRQRPWLYVFAGIFAYDAYLIRRHDDSLSRQFAAAARAEPLAVTAGVAYLLAHLYGVLPVRADAFRFAGLTAGRNITRKE